MKHVFVFLAEGFEEIEALTPVDVLRRAGMNVTLVSVSGNINVKSSHEITVVADSLFENTDFSDADMLVLPGGMPGSRHLDEHKDLHKLIIMMNNSGKFISAICAAPMVLGHLGLLEGKRATCFPGMESELNGAIYTNTDVEVSDNIITSKGAGTALPFSLILLEKLTSKEIAENMANRLCY